MDSSEIRIEGRGLLSGEYELSESVECAKYVLWTGVMTRTPTKILNPPDCKTLAGVIELLTFLGAEISTEDDVTIVGESISTLAIPKKNALSSHDAILLWAALLSRFQRSGIPETIITSYPYISPVLTAFGVKLELQNHYVVATYENRATARSITVPPSISFEERVLTEMVALIMAATCTEEIVIKQFVHSEAHEILTDILSKMGVSIKGDYPEITVCGVESLKGISYELPRSAREALITMSLVAVSKGDVMIKGFPTRQLARMTKRFLEKGVQFTIDSDVARVWAEKQSFLPTVQTIDEAHRLSSVWQTVLCTLGFLSEGETDIYVQHEVAAEIIPVLKTYGVEVTVLPATEDYVEVRIFGPTELVATHIVVTSYESAVCALLCAQSAKGESTIYQSSLLTDIHTNLFEKLKRLGMGISEDGT